MRLTGSRMGLAAAWLWITTIAVDGVSVLAADAPSSPSIPSNTGDTSDGSKITWEPGQFDDEASKAGRPGAAIFSLEELHDDSKVFTVGVSGVFVTEIRLMVDGSEQARGRAPSPMPDGNNGPTTAATQGSGSSATTSRGPATTGGGFPPRSRDLGNGHAVMDAGQLHIRAAVGIDVSSAMKGQDGRNYYNVTLTGVSGLQMSEVSLPPVMMNFRVSWGATSAGEGTSFSRNFTVVRRDDDIRSVASYQNRNLFDSSSPAFSDSFNDGATPGGGSATASTSAPTSTSGVSSNLSPSNSPASASSTNNSLATGAIAGIAVGAAVAVILAVSLLAWYLIRRRRRQQGDRVRTSPYGIGSGRRGHSRTADLMAEKEAATAGVTESPTHSPYLDDNLGRGGGGAGAAAASGAGAAATTAMLSAHDRDTRGLADHHHDAGQYSDMPSPSSPQQHQRTGSIPLDRSGSVAGASSVMSSSERGAAAAAAAAAGAAGTTTTDHRSSVVRSGTPQGMMGGSNGGRYAHLMDDGMTPEERARIEAEEAALDEAIERAGRQRTG